MIGNTSEDILILAIESSCDETAASVVKNGRTVLSNVITSQIATHTVYGGVVPEIASREHIKAVNYVIERALAEAQVSLEDITAIGRDLRSGAGRRFAGGSGGSQGPGLCCKKTAGWSASYRRPCVR